MKKDTDHIWPRVEGGPDKPWNKRNIPQRKNRQKGARMPNLNEVSDSSNPIRLAVEIDKHSLQGPFKHPRNRNRGFGGLPR
jgi:hypothetical protein